MLSRRKFLTIAVGLLPWTPRAAWPESLTPRTDADLTEALSALVGDVNGAVAIGREILSLYPDLLKKNSLGQAFEELRVPADHQTFFDVGATRERYQAALRHDFAAARIIEVRGWQLAQTEVWLFAFIAVKYGSNG